MRWEKLGLVFSPSGDLEWSRSHAYVPTPVYLEERKVIRVYFATWNKDQIGRVTYVDLNPNNPTEVVSGSLKIALDIGEVGAFDQDGVGPACVVKDQDKYLLFYYGFMRTQREGIHLIFAGLAESKDGGETFSRCARSPILDRTPEEPLLRSSVSVLQHKQGYEMWYTSADQWVEIGSNPLFSKAIYPRYSVRHLQSTDLRDWPGKSQLCIELEGEDEFGIGRPWVIKEKGLYRMWYSLRRKSKPYAIGYAESTDGLKWKRKDSEVGIERSKQGWDSEMICFPAVLSVGEQTYLFYNGNRHGAEGFGVARLVK